MKYFTWRNLLWLCLLCSVLATLLSNTLLSAVYFVAALVCEVLNKMGD